jgi:gliding motility-associated peptidyl-prolyl isomerase
MKILISCLSVLMMLLSCKKQEPRWPVSTRSGSFLKQSAERNRVLLEQEEALMEEIIALDSSVTYLESAFGSPYYFEIKNPDAGYTPQPEDEVSLTYSLFSWANDTLYRQEEIGTISYIVDREALFPGLRQAVKVLQEGETAVFLFPSSLGYGYHGDNNRIGTNMPLKCRLTLLSIKNQLN